MRLPISPFNAHAHGVAGPGAEGPATWDTARSRPWPASVPHDGVTHPIAVALPAEPQAYASALQALAQRPEEAISLDFALPFCAAHCLCCDRDILAAQPEEVIDDYVDGVLPRCLLRPVAVAGQRDAVGRHRDQAAQRVAPAGRALVRQTDHQTEIDVLHAARAGDLADVVDQRHRMAPADGLLHLQVEVEHAKVDAGEAQAAQQLHLHPAHPPWVAIDRHLGIGR